MACSNAWELETITEPDSPIEELEPPAGCLTILLVEDEEFVRQVTSEVLQSAGYHVLQAREAIEATVAFRQHRHDVRLLITDVVMPGQNGRDLARELRSVCPQLKTLFISGYPENVVPRDASEERTVFYLPKPFSAVSLVQSVKAILEQEMMAEASLAKRAAGNG